MVYVTDKIRFDVKPPRLEIALSRPKAINVNFGNIVIRDSHDHYHGAYEVIPNADNETILSTSDKVMDDDVVVRVIPYSETSNPTGYTAYIG